MIKELLSILSIYINLLKAETCFGCTQDRQHDSSISSVLP